MTIPNTNDVEELLSEIAASIAKVNGSIKQINDKNTPLNKEKNELKESVAKIEEWLTEEIKYSHEQEAEIYRVYQQAKAMWEKFREDSREIRDNKTHNASLRIKEIDEVLWDDRTALRNLESELASLQRRCDQALRLKKDAENYASLEERLNNAAMGAPWREWAKDHQLVGGKRIAFRGRMILADTMGLGKTLTSIVACDPIRAMTSTADADHPVVIETN